MFDRVELKSSAKRLLTKKYWWVVLVTLIFGLVSGSGTGLTYNFSGTSLLEEYEDSFGSSDELIIDEDGNFVYDDEYGYSSAGQVVDGIIDTFRMMWANSSYLLKIFVIIFLLIMVFAFLLCIFVFSPLEVGCRRWYIHNRKEKAEMSEIIYTFKHGYLNTVKVMFCRGLFTFLWSLLFVIPGIIKGYEYRMVPYLMAENPEMSMSEAFSRSKSLMNGNKWNAFILDLSFIGWNILSSFTCGILSVLYVAPYVQLTNTELYVCLCQGRAVYTEDNRANGNLNGN